HTAEQVREKVGAVYRSESRRIFATLIRLHDAFGAELERWPKEGVPASPRAWLVSKGRFKAIDAMRRRSRFDASQTSIAEQLGVRDARIRSRGKSRAGAIRRKYEIHLPCIHRRE